MSPRPPDVAPLGHRFGRGCRAIRPQLDLPLRAVASAASISISYLSRIERGVADPTLGVAARLAAALGAELALDLRPPVFLAEPARGDRIHAWCVAYVARRLRAMGWEVALEVSLVDGRYRGWIDLLAFDPATGVVLAIEVKTWLGDVGGSIRQVEWFRAHAWRLATARGWRPRVVAGALLVLATAENDALVHEHDIVLRDAFPIRGALPGKAGEQALALIDPARRRAT